MRTSILSFQFEKSGRRLPAPRSRTGKKPIQAKASEPTPDRIMQFAWGYAPTLILETALKYKIFDLLDRAPKKLQELVSRSKTSERGLRAILNALVGLNLLNREGEKYALTRESSKFLVSSRPEYHGMYFTHMTRQLLPRWMRLDEAVATGKPVMALNHEMEGQKFFSEFVESLFPLNYQAARALGAHLGIPKAKSRVSVLDIAAGSGVWGIALAQLSPLVIVYAVDWPEVLNVTRRVAVREGVAARLRTIPGDLLSVDLRKDHQLAILGHILHTEGVEKSQKVLQRVYDVLSPGGTVAISEFMPDEDRCGPANALIFAVNMLIHSERGDTFTFGEISGWLREAGFVNPRLLPAPAPSPLVLANKPG